MADTPALLGIDAGSTNLKLVAYTLEGELLELRSQPLEPDRPRPGWGEYDPEALYGHVVSLSKQIVEACRARGYVLSGVAVSSMAETAIPLDAASQPTHGAIAWWDSRGRDQANEVAERCDRAWWYERAGMHLSPLSGVSKLMWLREERPDAFERTRTWLNVADYIVFRLTGEMATDRSLAGRLCLMDISKQEWSADLLEATGTDPDLFAPLVWSGEQVGAVTREASEATGLPVGMPVGAGGMDHPVAAFGAGIVRPGDVLDSMGTTEAMLGVTASPVLNATVAGRRYQQGPNVVPGTTYVIGGLSTAGAAVDWLYELLWGGNADERDFPALIAEARLAEPGSRGLVFVPYLRYPPPPVESLEARGAMFGLSMDVRQAEMIRSLFEGIAHGIRFVVDGLVENFDVDPSRVVAVGGGQRNDLLMEIKAALAGGTIAKRADEPASKGAALLGGIAAGHFENHVAAVEAAVAPAEHVSVDDELVATYERIHRERFLPSQALLLPNFDLWL